MITFFVRFYLKIKQNLYFNYEWAPELWFIYSSFQFQQNSSNKSIIKFYEILASHNILIAEDAYEAFQTFGESVILLNYYLIKKKKFRINRKQLIIEFKEFAKKIWNKSTLVTIEDLANTLRMPEEVIDIYENRILSIIDSLCIQNQIYLFCSFSKFDHETNHSMTKILRTILENIKNKLNILNTR